MKKQSKQATETAPVVEPVAQTENVNVNVEAAPVEAAPVEAVNYATLMQRGVKLPLNTNIVDAGGLVITLQDAGRAVINGEQKHQLFNVCVSGNVVAVEGVAVKFTSPEIKAMLSASDYTISTARASRKGVSTISELTESVIESRYEAAAAKVMEMWQSYCRKYDAIVDYFMKVTKCSLSEAANCFSRAGFDLDKEKFTAELKRQFEQSAAAKAERKEAQKRIQTAAAVAASDDQTKRETLIATLRSCGCDVATINASLAAAGFAPIETAE